MAVTQTVKIEMLEKLPDGNYKLKYPKTTQEQIVGLETAQKILDKIKTVDGAGSGLDADLVKGRQVNNFSYEPLLTGSVTYNEQFVKGATVTKYIPIGSNKSFARLRIANSNGNQPLIDKAIVEATTSSLEAVAMGTFRKDISGLAYGRWKRSDIGFLINNQDGIGEYAIAGSINLLDCYISGTNIVLVFKNYDAGYQSNIYTRINWEVW